MRKASLLIFVGALFLSISTSWAASTPPQDITFDCHIEDIPLTKALQQLSEQSHQALIANPAHIQNFRSAPCQGLMNIESALQLILSNTGLVFKKTADNIFIITPQSNTQDQSRNASEIIITGIRHSVESALDIKNNANTFKDAIAQENVGKLPDDNIADAMQRITGVQIRRNNLGEGAAIQVRGFSQNRVEINNKT